jgi:hypothetical protein
MAAGGGRSSRSGVPLAAAAAGGSDGGSACGSGGGGGGGGSLDACIDAVVAQLRRGARGRSRPAAGQAGAAGRALDGARPAMMALGTALYGDKESRVSGGTLSALLACLRSTDPDVLQAALMCIHVLGCGCSGGARSGNRTSTRGA